MSNLRVLIIEDDPTLGQALHKCVRSSGALVDLAETAAEARDLVEKKRYQFILSDCLLPDEHGVDLLESLKQTHNLSRSELALMSGIFTDQASISEAKQRVNASHFFSKPFDPQEILKVLAPYQEALKKKKSVDDDDENPLKILQDSSASVRRKHRAIESLGAIDGYDLPMIYSVLVETKASGHLNIIGEDSEIAGVSLSDGNIVRVDLVDKKSYLGQLLVDSGYLSEHELEEQLTVKDNLKLGERLIQKCYVSPHAFNELLEYQMHIRLSKTIESSSVRINFVRSEVELVEPLITPDDFLGFLHDWIVSKLGDKWIEARLRPYYSHRVQPGPHYVETHSIFESKLLSSLPNLWHDITSAASLGDAIDMAPSPKGMYLKAIHYLLLKRIIVFVEETENTFVHFEKQISSLLVEVEGKNHFTVFEKISGKNSVELDEVRNVYDEFMIYAQKRGLDSQGDELKEKVGKLIGIVEDAFEVIGEEGNRKNYLEELQKHELTTKLKVQQTYEQAVQLVRSGDPLRALKMFDEISKKQIHFEHFHLYSAWSKISCLERQLSPNIQIADLEFDLMQVPPEEKHGALFSFVLGKEKAFKGQLKEARRLFEKASSLDPRMIDARRELNRLKLKEKQQKKQKDFLNRDLKEMVTSLFRKKGS